jgi:glycosyltransferase involved in cell wall biosynthesis
METPLISVVIPAYNGEQFLSQSIGSVLAQTYRNLELIVVDDGSTDGSVKILENYGARIRLLRQKNRGAGAARNTGIRAARGKWIAFLDSDDRWLPEKLACQLQCLEKFGARICYSRCVTESGEPLPDLEEVASTLKEPDIHHIAEPVEFLCRARHHPYLQSMVLERQLFETVGWFDETLCAGEDTLLLFKLSFESDCLYLNQPLTVIHRFSGNSLTYDLKPAAAEKRFNSCARVQAEMYWRLLELAPEKARLTRQRLGYFISRRAELACAAGNLRLARTLARDGLALAGDWRTFVRCAVFFLAPFLARAKVRRKWYRS